MAGRRLLDHTSHTMTARYARLGDTTIREQWDRAQKINIRGEPIDTSTDGPLADAAWMKQNLIRAKWLCPTDIAVCRCRNRVHTPTPA
jgi:hypothetical protein